jgi:hypothetical protein
VVGLAFWQGSREWFAQAALHEAAHVTFSGLPRRGIDDSMVDAIAVYAEVRREHPYTFAGALAEETVRELLLSELERMRETAQQDADETERLVRRLSSVRWPRNVRRLWGDSRDLMLETIAARRAAIEAEE